MALTIFFKFQSISSLPSVATDDRKQYHCLNIGLQEQNYTINFGIRLMRKHVLRKQIALHNPWQVFGLKIFSDRILFSLRIQPTLGDATTGFPAKWRLRNEHRNSILRTRHFPHLGSASDWSCRVGNLFQPIRSASSVQNFCARFSDVIWWGNHAVVTSPNVSCFLRRNFIVI